MIARTSSRDEIAAHIERLRHAETLNRARFLARSLDPVLGTLDSELREQLASALEVWGIDPDIARAPLGLTVGESWLLLHAGGREGHVARLFARAKRPGEEGSPTSAAASALLPDGALAAPMRALAGAAARVCRQLPREIRDNAGVEIVSAGTASFAMTGRSFQLSAAVALLSRALGRPALATCAGSACVGLDGALSSVDYLEEKVSTLQRDFPDVRTVVVATAQALPDLGERVVFVRAATLEQALAAFELDIKDLPHSGVDEHLLRASSFEHRNKQALHPEEWRALSVDAWESCVALGDYDPAASTRCRAWAALFAVHAGDTEDAENLVKGGDSTLLEANPALDAWMHVIRGTNYIDRGELEEAVAQGALAVRKSDALDRSERLGLRGRALGTHGRALMHAGRLEDAELALREAVAHHRTHAPKDLAQSLSYLAICLRRAGALEGGLTVIDEALNINSADTLRSSAAQATESYLRLERGRILSGIGRYDEAERDLLTVAPLAELTMYPRLGAERSLVRLRIASGDLERAREAFLRCFAATRALVDSGRGGTIAKVGAVGLAEAMSGLELAPEEHEEASALFQKAFDRPATSDVMRNVLATWIF